MDVEVEKTITFLLSIGLPSIVPVISNETGFIILKDCRNPPADPGKGFNPCLFKFFVDEISCLFNSGSKYPASLHVIRSENIFYPANIRLTDDW